MMLSEEQVKKLRDLDVRIVKALIGPPKKQEASIPEILERKG